MTTFQPPRSPEIKSTRLVANQDELRHILLTKSGVILTLSNNDAAEGSFRIRTELPDDIKAALAIDDPVEFVCLSTRLNQADVGRGVGTPQQNPKKTRCKFCLYSRKDAFVIDLEFESPSKDGNHQDINGTVIEITEPLEHETAVSGAEILRIRAPSKTNQTLIAPSGCFAALVKSDREWYHIYLYHHKGNRAVAVTNPFAVSTEAVPQEEIVDFCFAESGGLSLFASLSILLLKESGDILAASPFVFEGSIVSKARLEQSLSFLREENGRSPPKLRQCKAAQIFLNDTFCIEDSGGRFLTAKIIDQPSQMPSHWPVASGTVFYQSPEEKKACCIEVLGGFDRLVGVSVGKEDCQVDYIAISPSNLLPRFELESREDRYAIEDEIMKASRCVESVCLDLDTKGIWSIVSDSVSPELLHCVTDSGVYTISSNALQESDNILKGNQPSALATSAWIALNTSSSIIGLGLNDDLTSGHNMVVHLENGKSSTVNITETQSRHDFKRFFEPKVVETPLLTNGSDPSLFDSIQPLLRQINDGMANMAAVSGSETKYTDIGTEELAAVVAIKQQCDDELVLPMQELKKIVESCRGNLQNRLEEQKRQLEGISKQVRELKAKITSNTETLEAAQKLAKSQLARGKFLLDTTKKMVPKLTDAELLFARDIQRYQRKCTTLEKLVKAMKEKTAASAMAHDVNWSDIQRISENKEHLGTLFSAIENTLEEAKKSWAKADMKWMQMNP